MQATVVHDALELSPAEQMMMEYQFRKLRRRHKACCVGAVFCEDEKEIGWIAIVEEVAEMRDWTENDWDYELNRPVPS